jgi:hypothetical protein
MRSQRPILAHLAGAKVAGEYGRKERRAEKWLMILDLARALSLILSILSLYPVMLSAFFVPGSRWEDRLSLSLLKIALAAGICFASGLLFAFRPQARTRMAESVMTTLPVQLFFWAMVGMGILFVVSWYLEEYYVPLLWRNQP